MHSPSDAGPILGEHIVRYGTAGDQHYLVEDFLRTYDQLLINARMVAHMSAGLTSFLLKRARNKPYFIDPETHAFQHALEHIESTDDDGVTSIKRSVRILAEKYGEPVTKRVRDDKQPVLPSDFLDPDLRRAFCERVLKFQATSLATRAEDTPEAKYYQFLQEEAADTATSNFKPRVLVAPYFFLTSTTLEHWLDVNIKCVANSQDIAVELGVPLAVEIALTEDILLDDTKRAQVVAAYKTVQPAPAVFLLWIDNFPEHTASEGALLALAQFVKDLGKRAPTVNLFGGYLSVAAMRAKCMPSLIGVCHGLEYGEHRSVVPVGGGVPVSKFYFNPLHIRLVFRQALLAANALDALSSRDKYLESLCDCDECKRVVAADPREDFATYGRTRTVPPQGKRRRALEFPLPETKEHCVRHYMWAKFQEYTSPSFAIADIVGRLRHTNAQMANKVSPSIYGHCGVWASVLAKLAGIEPEQNLNGHAT